MNKIRRARQIHLKQVLERLGFRLLPRPGGNYTIAGLANEIVIKDHYWNCPHFSSPMNPSTLSRLYRYLIRRTHS